MIKILVLVIADFEIYSVFGVKLLCILCELSSVYPPFVFVFQSYISQLLLQTYINIFPSSYSQLIIPQALHIQIMLLLPHILLCHAVFRNVTVRLILD